MKLTRRQEEFIKNLVELNQEFNRPIHYSVLADRLGVSPFTAYDMLCMLEEKGVVTSEYQLAAEKNGPGRAERLFCPVESVQERELRMTNKMGDQLLDKDELKLIVLDRIHRGELWENELTEEMLARIPPDENGEISYCIEVMKIAALRLQQSNTVDLFLEHLPEILPNGSHTRGKLSLLGGFVFGLLAQENASDDEWIQKLFEHVLQYLQIVINISPEECDQLARKLNAVFTRLTEETG